MYLWFTSRKSRTRVSFARTPSSDKSHTWTITCVRFMEETLWPWHWRHQSPQHHRVIFNSVIMLIFHQWSFDLIPLIFLLLSILSSTCYIEQKYFFFSDIYTKTPVDTSGLEPLHESSPTSFVVFRDQGCGPEEGPSVSPAHHMPSTSSAAAVAAAAAAILSDLPDVSTRWGH